MKFECQGYKIKAYFPFWKIFAHLYFNRKITKKDLIINIK